MAHHYLLKNRYVIPNFLFAAIASWAIALTAVTVIEIIIWIVSDTAHVDVLATLPKALGIFLGLCGAYAAVGAITLYVTMWVYWVGVERSSWGIRIGWLLALLFGLHYGSLVYAFYVWRTGIKKLPGPYPGHSNLSAAEGTNISPWTK